MLAAELSARSPPHPTDRAGRIGFGPRPGARLASTNYAAACGGSYWSRDGDDRQQCTTTFGSSLRWAMSGAVSRPPAPRCCLPRSEVPVTEGCTALARSASDPLRYRFPWENTVSVFKYAVAAAVGYYVGQPNGRRQVQGLREQAVELVRGPRAKQLKERGWDIAVERTSAAINGRSAGARTARQQR